MVCINDRIKEELDRQQRGVSWLADKLGCSRMTIYRILDKNSIDTNMLTRISLALNYNFFKDLSEDINEYTTI